MADITLTVDYEFKTDLNKAVTDIIDKINANYPKIKVGFDIDAPAYKEVTSQVKKAQKSLKNEVNANINNIGKEASAMAKINDLQKSLGVKANTNAKNITKEISAATEATKGLGQLAKQTSYYTGEFDKLAGVLSVYKDKRDGIDIKTTVTETVKDGELIQSGSSVEEKYKTKERIIKEYTARLQELANAQKKVAQLSTSIEAKQRALSKVNGGAESSYYSKLGTQKENAQGLYSDLLKGEGTYSAFRVSITELDAAITKTKAEADDFISTQKRIAKTSEQAGNSVQVMTDKIARSNAALKEIKTINSSITTSYKKLQESLNIPGATEQDISNIQELRNKYIELQAAIEKVQKAEGVTTQEDLGGIYKLQAEMKNLIAQTQNRINKEKTIDISGIAASYESLKKQLNVSEAAPQDIVDLKSVTEKYSELQAAIEAVQSSDNSATQDELNNIHKLQIETEKLINAVQKRVSVEDEARIPNANENKDFAKSSQKIALMKKYEAVLARCKAALRNYTAAENSANSSMAYKDIEKKVVTLEEARSAYDNGTSSFAQFKEEIGQADRALVKNVATIKENGDATQTFRDKLSGLISKFSSWLTASQLVMLVINTMRKMISAVTDLDTAMTELKKVTDEPDETYNQFLERASFRANKLASSLTDVVTATADFARLGYDIEGAEKLSDAAIIYKNVGDGISDISEASESIIATMQAFGISADEAMSIVDKFNEAGNNYAISSQGIGEALLRSAAAMKSANNTLDETIALTTAANTIVQDPEKVGTTLKTISMYLRAAKTEAEEAGESTDGMASSVSKLREEILSLTGNKVDIQLDDSTFKSTYQILKELANVRSELTDVSKANILEKVGGKRNANVVAALLENFTVADSALISSKNAAGSAAAENEKYLDSVRGKLNILGSTFEALSKDIINSNFMKEIITSGTEILNLISNINKGLGLMPTLIATISGILLTKNNMGILNTDNSGSLGLFTQTRKNNINIEAKQILDAIIQSQNEFEANKKSYTDETAGKIDIMNKKLTEYSDRLTDGVAETGNFVEAQKKLQLNVEKSKEGVSLFSRGLGKLKSVGSTLVQGLANAGASLAVGFVISFVSNFITEQIEKMQKAAEAADQLDEKSKSLSTVHKQVSELREKLDSANTSENEAITIRKQLYEIQEDLIKQYGTEAGQIDLVRDSVDSLSESFKKLDNASVTDWYNEHSGEATKAVDSIYGKDSIGDLINSGNESFGITIVNPDSNDKQNKSRRNAANDVVDTLRAILGDDYVGASGRDLANSNGYSISVNIGSYIKDHSGTKRDLALMQDKLIESLTNMLSEYETYNLGVSDDNKKQTEPLEKAIEILTNAKNYWQDDNYSKELGVANKYAQYLVSQNSDQKEAYEALQAAEADYKTALESGSSSDINKASANLKTARDTINDIINGLDKTGTSGAIRNFLTEAISDANSYLSKDDLKLKIQTDKNFFKVNLEKQLDIFGNGKRVSKDDILKYTIKNTDSSKQVDAAFKLMQESAKEAGLSIEDFCDVLIDLGIIEGDVLKDTVKAVDKLNFSDIFDANADSMKAAMENLDGVQSAFASLKEVIADYNTSGVISIDNLQKLISLGDEYIGYLFDENGNLTLNEQAYQKLTKAKLNSIKMDILKNTIDNIKKITDESSAQEYLAKKINDTTEATKGYSEAILRAYVSQGIAKGGKIKEAVTDLYTTYKQYIALIDNTDTTWANNTNATNSQTRALENQKEALEGVKDSQEKEKEALEAQKEALEDNKETLEKQKEALEDNKEALEKQKEALEDLKSAYEDDKSSIEDLIDLTAEYVKQTYEDKIQSLEDEKDAYKDKIDASKEAIEALENELDAEKDLYEYQRSISDKTKDISTTKKQMAALKNSTSTSDKKRYQELQGQLSEQQQDLADYQYDQSITRRKEALEDQRTQLDEQYNRKENLLNAEISKIRSVADNERRLREEAMRLIDSRSNEFYNNLWNYVYQYTTKSRFEFENLWNSAYSALDNYNLGQFSCMQIMELLEYNIYNVGLQIDAVQSNIDKVAGAIDVTSSAINNISSAIDETSSAINDISSAIDGTSSAIDDVANKIDKLKTNLENTTTAKTNFDTAFNGNIETTPTYEATLGGYVYTSKQPTPESAAADIANQHNDYLNKYTGQGSPFHRYSEDEVIKQLRAYAKGTRHSKGGLSIVDEEGIGTELILDHPSKGRYTTLTDGSIVFNKEQTENLWNLSKLPDPQRKFLNMYNKFSSKFSEGIDRSGMKLSSLYDTLRASGGSYLSTIDKKSNETINAPIQLTVYNTNGLNEEQLANKIQNKIIKDFVRLGKHYG